MIIFTFFSLLLPQVLGDDLVKDGNCDGDPKNPGKTVENCNYYCRNGNDWVNKYFPAGTKCQYEVGRMGTCLAGEDGSTGCNLDTDVGVENSGHGGKESTTEGEETTTPSKRKKRSSKKQKETKKPKSPSDAPKQTKEKKKTKKKRHTQVAEW